MRKVGDEIGGYCPRCRLNVNMNVAATDGREVFTVTCRTCHNTSKYTPEKSSEVVQAEALKKLARMRKRKEPRRIPQVISRRKRVDGEADEAMLAEQGAEPMRPATSMASAQDIPKTKIGATWGASRKSIDLPQEAAPMDDGEARLRWRKLTANLGPRDGSTYVPGRAYATGDVMLHKRHGMGIVESVLLENACMVLFREGGKVIEMAIPG